MTQKVLSAVAAAGGLVLWLLWQSLLLAALYLPPPVAAAWAVAVVATFLWVHAARHRWNRRLRAWTRLRVPPPRPGATIALAVALVVLLHALTVALLALGLAVSDEFPPELLRFLERPGGGAAFFLLAVVAIPVVEEVGFRGWVQRPLERGMGPAVAIPLTAVLFAGMHLGSALFPVRLAGGLVLGQAVFATRSTATGIVLHAAWNASALALGALLPDWDPTGAGARWAAPALAAGGAALLACVWGVRRLEAPRGA
jgi:membrane protease YdiL (CAAX protease family)